MRHAVYPMTTLAATLVSAVLAVPAAAQYQVQGRFLYDPNGDRVVIRGTETSFPTDASGTTEIPQIAQTGANCVRILNKLSPQWGLSLAQMETRLVTMIDNGMLPQVWVNDGSGVLNTVLRPDVQELLKKYQDHITLNVLPETPEVDVELWRTRAKDAITAARQAGYVCPLSVMSHRYGRDLPTTLLHGQEIVDHDPLGNVIVGWQAYWGDNADQSRNWYEGRYGLTLEEGLAAIAQLDYPVQVGLLADDGSASSPYPWIDYPTIMALAAEHDISWLHWDWHNHYALRNSLSTTGQFGDWNSTAGHIHGEDWGYQIAVGHPGSIANTSVRTPYLLNGAVWGDVDRSGTVDDADLNLLLTHWGQSGTGWTEGDMNGDDVVDDRDLSLLLSHWGAGISAVPEPGTLGLLAASILAGFFRLHR